MPYKIEERDGEWLILKDTGKIVGRSKTKADAEASVRARLSGEFGDSVKEAKFIPPEAGDAPRKVKEILVAVYDSIRTAWVKEHPEDKDNDANKTSAAQQAWAAVKNAGWEKDVHGLWKLKEETFDAATNSFMGSTKTKSITWVSTADKMEAKSAPSMWYPNICVRVPDTFGFVVGAECEMVVKGIIESVVSTERGKSIRISVRSVGY